MSQNTDGSLLDWPQRFRWYKRCSAIQQQRAVLHTNSKYGQKTAASYRSVRLLLLPVTDSPGF